MRSNPRKIALKCGLLALVAFAGCGGDSTVITLAKVPPPTELPPPPKTARRLPAGTRSPDVLPVR